MNKITGNVANTQQTEMHLLKAQSAGTMLEKKE